MSRSRMDLSTLALKHLFHGAVLRPTRRPGSRSMLKEGEAPQSSRERTLPVPSSVRSKSDFLAACGTVYGFSGSLWGDKAHSVVFDNTKLKRLVPGFTAVKRADQGIREAVDYILSHPECQIEDHEFDIWCDKVIAAREAALQSLI